MGRKIYYLLINEDLNSGIIQSQVLLPLKSQKREILVINIHKPFKRPIKLHKNIINIPLAVPYSLFLFQQNPILIKFFNYVYSILLSFLIKKDSSIIARSYFPSLICKTLKEKRIINSYVFDSRSLFIHENMKAGLIKENSRLERFWKKSEKEIILKADKTIAVSLAQKEYYNCICKNSNIIIIPCYITPGNLIDSISRKKLREQYGFGSEVVIAYYGSLDWKWNNIGVYSSFFKEALDSGYHIMIISQNYNELKNIYEVQRSGITLIDTRKMSINDLNVHLQLADYGVVLMEKSHDWKSRLSVKFVEYLNNGIKPIVGKYVGEAVRLGAKYFKEDLIIYNDLNDINKLSPLVQNNRSRNVDIVFGHQNLAKVIDEIS